MIAASVSAQRRDACLVTRSIQRPASVIVQREHIWTKRNRNVLECEHIIQTYSLVQSNTIQTLIASNSIILIINVAVVKSWIPRLVRMSSVKTMHTFTAN